MANVFGEDPHFFTKCMDELENNSEFWHGEKDHKAPYDKKMRASICARAHYIVTGIWPGAHGGDDPNANEGGETPGRKEVSYEKLKKLLIEKTLKGSKKSGFYGHAGRPGQKGGSAQMSRRFTPKPETLRKHEEDVDQPDPDQDEFGHWRNLNLEDPETIFDKPIEPKVPEELYEGSLFDLSEFAGLSRDGIPYDQISGMASVATMFEGYDERSGITVKRYDLEYSDATEEEHESSDEGDTFRINCRLEDKNGNRVGLAEISYDGEDGAVTLDLLTIDDKYRSSGFGSRYIEHIEDVAFNELSANSVQLHANIDVGGYFWARCGYDADGREVEYRKEKLIESCVDRYGGSEMEYRDLFEDFSHMWDIASARGPDGFKIGKQLLLGSNWMGYKMNPDYDDGDGGWNIGAAYYDSRKGKTAKGLLRSDKPKKKKGEPTW